MWRIWAEKRRHTEVLTVAIVASPHIKIIRKGNISGARQPKRLDYKASLLWQVLGKRGSWGTQCLVCWPSGHRFEAD